MKKITIFFLLLVAATFTVFAATNWFQKEQPVNKEINLAITSSNNYSSAAYNDAKASVHITITKISSKQKTVVLDKVYDAMQLSLVPTNGNAINSKVIIPNVFNGKEKLMITYCISYNSRGSIIEFCNGKVASDKSNNEKIQINI